jgi:hypothetical protein
MGYGASPDVVGKAEIIALAGKQMLIVHCVASQSLIEPTQLVIC